MAVFEANGFAINTAYVTMVGEIKGSRSGATSAFTSTSMGGMA